MFREYNYNMLAPSAITQAQVLSGPPNAESQVWDGAETYQTGDLVWDAGHTFRSLSDSNAANTSDASNWEGLGEVDGGALAFDAATDYNADDTAVYDGYVWSAVTTGVNVGNVPSDDSAHWSRLRATNRMKPFDTYLQDAAEISDELVIKFQPVGRTTHLVMFRLEGDTARVQVGETGGPIDYDVTADIIEKNNRTNLHRYLFSQINSRSLAIFADMPIYSNPEITVTITGANAAVGQICFGVPNKIGAVLTGGAIGITDNSTRTDDGFGRVGIQEGAYAETLDSPVLIRSEDADSIRSRFAKRRALPTVFFMDDGAELGQVIYGTSPQFEILMEGPVVSKYLHQAEGLT